MSVEMINKACKFYPCHKNLESCVFCYCPFYVCGNKHRGKYITNAEGKLIWDCSKCEWIHKKSTVDKIFKEVNKIFYSIKSSKK
jgi:Zn-finger protein